MPKRRRRSLRNATIQITGWGREILRRAHENPRGPIVLPNAPEQVRVPATWEERRYMLPPRLIIAPPGQQVVQVAHLDGPPQSVGPVSIEGAPATPTSAGFHVDTYPVTQLHGMNVAVVPQAPWHGAYVMNEIQHGTEVAEHSLERAAALAEWQAYTQGTNTITSNNYNYTTAMTAMFSTGVYLSQGNTNRFMAWNQYNTGGPYHAWNNTAYMNETPEQRAEREAKHKLFEAEKQKAKVTAEKLLVRHLTGEQREEWEKHRWVTVQSEGGNLYRIREGYSRNIDRIVDGKTVKRYCIHPSDSMIPDADVVLVQKFLIESDEQRFLKVANASDVRPHELPSYNLQNMNQGIIIGAAA